MATDIVMPQLGESIAEGTVVKWLIPRAAPSTRISHSLKWKLKRSPSIFRLPRRVPHQEILVPEGQTVPVGKLLARLDNQPATGVVNPCRRRRRAADGDSATDHHYSPAVRQLARERGLDLASDHRNR